MKPYMMPETNLLGGPNDDQESDKHLPNGTCLSQCYSLPSTLNRKKKTKKDDLNEVVNDNFQNDNFQVTQWNGESKFNWALHYNLQLEYNK